MLKRMKVEEINMDFVYVKLYEREELELTSNES